MQEIQKPSPLEANKGRVMTGSNETVAQNGANGTLADQGWSEPWPGRRRDATSLQQHVYRSLRRFPSHEDAFATLMMWLHSRMDETSRAT